MRGSTRPRRSRRSARPFTSKRRKEPCWWWPSRRRDRRRAATNQQQGGSMFWKTVLAVIATVAIAFLFKSAGMTIAVFLIAMFAVFISEGVRIVPQQSAWVVERLGKFSRVLEP